ncbi:23486_t:CDS:2 [Dentiscutata erythropus]|uniref:Alpha-galactosidase n=1 Tax=Dentiscutata erythropus TaxID=1348616 RepID=A0A9N8WKR0_9GLOM|nr:23486_t:CDS:2 [Dentiscutata erythropus]
MIIASVKEDLNKNVIKQSDPWLWGTGIGNSWRTSVNINGFWTSRLSIIDSQVRITQYGGPGGWNDPDMLAVGFDVIPPIEQITHYAFWAALKVSLILGCDVDHSPFQNTAVNISEHGVEFKKLTGGTKTSSARPCLDYSLRKH